MATIQASANLMPIGAENRLPSLEDYQNTKSYNERKKIRDEYRRRGIKPPHMATGKPSKIKGVPRPEMRGPRPHMRGVPKLNARRPRPKTWITGPDEQLHKMYDPFLKQRAQAQFRQEPWALTFDQWVAVWNGQFHLRGRSAESLCMTMLDPDIGWIVGNVEIITRREHLQRQIAYRTAKRKGLI